MLEDRGVQVIDVHGILDGAEAELVGGAEDLAALDPAACQPDRDPVNEQGQGGDHHSEIRNHFVKGARALVTAEKCIRLYQQQG